MAFFLVSKYHFLSMIFKRFLIRNKLEKLNILLTGSNKPKATSSNFQKFLTIKTSFARIFGLFVLPFIQKQYGPKEFTKI